MSIQKKLDELGIILPTASDPLGAYVPVVQSGNLLFVSGQVPMMDGRVAFAGKVGQEINMTQAHEAVRLCVVNALAAINDHLGSLDAIARIVRLEVFVNSAEGFTEQAQVANGASQMLHSIFGPIGRHARLAIGVAELPANAVVEIAMIAEKK